MSNAWQEGYDAYQNDTHWADNPYSVHDADEWLEWDAGWSQAQHEDGAIAELEQFEDFYDQ